MICNLPTREIPVEETSCASFGGLDAAVIGAGLEIRGPPLSSEAYVWPASNVAEVVVLAASGSKGEGGGAREEEKSE